MSFAVICCHLLFDSLSLVAIQFTRCHLLSLDISLVCLFINDPRNTSNEQTIAFARALQNECPDEIENVQEKCGILLLSASCDFIKMGLHHGDIMAECFDLFFSGKLFHKIALIRGRAKSNTYCSAKPNPQNRNTRRKFI